MPAGRPRTSPDPHAHRGRLLGDAELAGSAPSFLVAPAAWLDETKHAYETYKQSETAKALRSEDVYAVVRLFSYLDRLSRWWRDLPDDPTEARAALQAIRSLEEMAGKLATALGIGPRARQSLGIRTENRPGSRLAAMRDSGEG